MGKAEKLVAGRWRIVESKMWDQEALDLVVPAHITFEDNGLGEMDLIAMSASIDYRVENRSGALVVEFSWFGFDEMDQCSGRVRATIDGDVMHGELFIHAGDDSSFIAKRERLKTPMSGADRRTQPTGAKNRPKPRGHSARG